MISYLFLIYRIFFLNLGLFLIIFPICFVCRFFEVFAWISQSATVCFVPYCRLSLPTSPSLSGSSMPQLAFLTQREWRSCTFQTARICRSSLQAFDIIVRCCTSSLNVWMVVVTALWIVWSYGSDNHNVPFCPPHLPLSTLEAFVFEIFTNSKILSNSLMSYSRSIIIPNSFLIH